ncbi:hypothetical protein [Rhizobium straminoryzae]|uniref:Uncharacterized protein n=1 Tax=Rhizobium straminoryzae TaxID=1387186 RepID=A0A549T0W4_9HYPH|nr:hypothetical protein [Rhizobium straminoryzae]TRL35513.1 hypothetical protein FNA46_20150 [Rhizobium straminoryzae]
MSGNSVRFYLVTDRPQEAALIMFGLDLPFVPAWARVVHQPQDILAIPSGVRAVALWLGPPCFLQEIWTLRRTQIEIRGEGWDTWDALNGWRKQRAAAMASPEDGAATAAEAPPPPQQQLETVKNPPAKPASHSQTSRWL